MSSGHAFPTACKPPSFEKNNYRASKAIPQGWNALKSYCGCIRVQVAKRAFYLAAFMSLQTSRNEVWGQGQGGHASTGSISTSYDSPIAAQKRCVCLTCVCTLAPCCIHNLEYSVATLSSSQHEGACGRQARHRLRCTSAREGGQGREVVVMQGTPVPCSAWAAAHSCTTCVCM